MIYINGKYEYFCFENDYGQNHRIGGPAIIEGDFQAWFKNGKFHRIGGPAYIDGYRRYWYIEDRQYTETEYHNKIKEMEL